MGFESDYMLIASVGLEESFVAALGPSIEEAHTLNILTREDAIKYVALKVIEIGLNLFL